MEKSNKEHMQGANTIRQLHQSSDSSFNGLFKRRFGVN